MMKSAMKEIKLGDLVKVKGRLAASANRIREASLGSNV